MTGLLVTVLLGVAGGAEDAARPTGELAAPVRIEAAGKPIDTAVGHAAPFVGDFDGDKVPRPAGRPVRRGPAVDLPQ